MAKGKFSSQSQDMEKWFKENGFYAHVSINARREADINIKDIQTKLSKAIGSSYDKAQGEKSKFQGVSEGVASVQEGKQKVISLKTEFFSKFWIKMRENRSLRRNNSLRKNSSWTLRRESSSGRRRVRSRRRPRGRKRGGKRRSARSSRRDFSRGTSSGRRTRLGPHRRARRWTATPSSSCPSRESNSGTSRESRRLAAKEEPRRWK